MNLRPVRRTLSSAILLILALPLTSLEMFAQPANTDSSTSKANTKPVTAKAESEKIEVITVTTARRRGEAIQDVPVAVTSFTADALQKQQVVDLESLNLSVPNVTIVRNTGTTVGAQVYIRGVGNDDSSFTIEPPVSIYLDDVYIGRQIGAVLDVLDFERIEFVRGPQGTLYGRNSSAGAIKYISRKPNLVDSKFGGAISGGTYGKRSFNISANMPFADNSFAVKLDIGTRSQDGWMKIVNAAGQDTGQRANAIDNQAGRISALWSATSSTDIFLSYDVATNASGPQAIASTNCTGLIGAGVSPFAPNSAFNVVCPFRFDARTTGNGAPDINKFRGWGSNLTITTDLGGAEFKAISGYRGFKDDLALDLSGNPAAPFNLIQYLKQKQFSQELQLTSKAGGALDWIVGAFYFDETVDQNAVFGGRRNIDTQEAKSHALYGELNWRFAPDWTLTIGGRQSKDKKSIGRQYFLSPTDINPSVTLAMGTNDYTQSKFTPKVGIDVKLNKNALLYATWGEGYRAGGYAAARPTSAQQLGGQIVAETVTSWETGLKSEWLAKRVKLNLAYFQSTYKNLQSSVLGADGSFTVISGDAKFSGVDFEGAFRVTPDWNMYAIAGFLKDEWTRQPPGTVTAVRLKHVPRSQYKIGSDYRFQQLGPGYFTLAANYRWTDEIYRSTANHLNIRSPAYGLVDAQISYEWNSGQTKLILAGTNLTDKIYWTQGVSTLGRYIGQPRLVSLTLDARF
jgi:iron complex outermembrane recepter protein